MGIVKGSKEYDKFKAGKSLTRKEAMLAMCFDCMGGVMEDCLADMCPMFQYRTNKGK